MYQYNLKIQVILIHFFIKSRFFHNHKTVLTSPSTPSLSGTPSQN